MTEESLDALSESEVIKMAYLKAQRLKASGLDDEAVYARLEKQGIPAHIAAQVALDIHRETKSQQRKEVETTHHSALIKIGVGIAGALVSMIVIPDHYVLPIGMIVGGIITAVWTKLKMD